MSDIPYFFFSYSKPDWNRYLKRFFDDLRTRVAELTEVRDASTVGFRDENDITTGDDWNGKISSALQISRVLVCIYSPRFFSANRTNEFCAKEFAAFLKRHKEEIRYDRDPQGNVQVRGARNIIPILWISEKDLLEFHNLPPQIVRSIQYSINVDGEMDEKTAIHYKAAGLHAIVRRNTATATYDKIISHFARLIVKSSAAPLPSLDPPPTVQDLWNAFWVVPEQGEPHGDALLTITVEPRAVAPAASPRGPGHMIAIEVRGGSDGAPDWTPYAGRQGIAAAVEEIAYDRQLVFSHTKLDPGANDFVAKALSMLNNATDQQATPILFVDPQCLQTYAQRDAVIGLLRSRWRGGLVIPVDRSDEDTVRLIENIHSSLEQSMIDRDWIVVRPSIGTMTDFRTSVISVADEVLAKIVNHGVVQQKPSPNAGPDTRPRIANIQDVRVSLS